MYEYLVYSAKSKVFQDKYHSREYASAGPLQQLSILAIAIPVLTVAVLINNHVRSGTVAVALLSFAIASMLVLLALVPGIATKIGYEMGRWVWLHLWLHLASIVVVVSYLVHALDVH